MRVLVVEDHRRLAEAVAGGLRDEGMAGATWPSTGRTRWTMWAWPATT